MERKTIMIDEDTWERKDFTKEEAEKKLRGFIKQATNLENFKLEWLKEEVTMIQVKHTFLVWDTDRKESYPVLVGEYGLCFNDDFHDRIYKLPQQYSFSTN